MNNFIIFLEFSKGENFRSWSKVDMESKYTLRQMNIECLKGRKEFHSNKI